MKKKIIKIIASLLIFVMALGGAVVNAQENDFYEILYSQKLCDDFVILTGCTKGDADIIFNEIKEEGINEKEVEEVEKILSVKNEDVDCGEIVIFIQDNYNDVICNLTISEKRIIDKYLLLNALQYYENNYKIDEFLDEFGTKQNSKQNSLKETSGATRGVSGSLRIFSCSDGISSWSIAGHAWITITNTGSESFDVAGVTIVPGLGWSFGTWGNQSEHNGLWYDLESWYYTKQQGFSGRVSLHSAFSSISQIDPIINYIASHDKWSANYNCAGFAVGVWNSVFTSAGSISAGLIPTPTSLANAIKARNGTTDATMTTATKAYYADGTGKTESTVYYK